MTEFDLFLQERSRALAEWKLIELFEIDPAGLRRITSGIWLTADIVSEKVDDHIVEPDAPSVIAFD